MFGYHYIIDLNMKYTDAIISMNCIYLNAGDTRCQEHMSFKLKQNLKDLQCI